MAECEEDDIDRQPFIRSDDARLRGSELSYEAAEELLRYRQEWAK